MAAHNDLDQMCKAERLAARFTPSLRSLVLGRQFYDSLAPEDPPFGSIAAMIAAWTFLSCAVTAQDKNVQAAIIAAMEPNGGSSGADKS